MPKIPNINQMLSMAQNMAKQMEEQMDAVAVEGSSGGGMVSVKMDGHKRVQSLRIAPEAVDRADIDMLQDLIVAAINDAQGQVEEKLKSGLGGMGGGLPGGFPFGAL
ncbi:MAG: YbaB/EbfC family nucleoid-associated protein [Candidatus Aminicenantes bacterium]|nr:YbaB/EbfC family nucleoid-associated protein [Candidatus Aminicenantes bacterium]